MAYVSEKATTNRLIGIGFVVLLHIALVFLLVSGLGKTAIQIVQGPIDVAVIEDQVQEEAPPPPPPPVIDKLPPPFVPPPEFNITATPSSTNAITDVAREVPVVLPKAIKGRSNKQPEYPPSARRLKQQGTVTMLLFVGLDGRVSEAKVETSSGHAILDEAAVKEALRSWRYAPGIRNGQPTAMWTRASVKFQCGLNGCG